MTKRRRTKYQGVYFDEDAGTYGYVVDVAGPGQPRDQQRKGGFEHAADARDAREKVRRAVRGGTYAPPSKLTVTELLEVDFETQLGLGRLRASTVDTYRQLVGRYIAPRVGSLRAQELRASQLDALYGDLLEKGLSPSTVDLVHSTGSGAFSRAVKRGDVTENPFRRATPPAVRTRETASWSLPELRAFLAHEAVRADRDFPLWWTLATTALRRGECLGLRWDDVDLDAGVLFVRHNAVLVDGKVMIGEPKTRRSRRRVKIGADTVQVLRDHLARQREHRLVMGAGWSDNDKLVFPGVDGRPRNPANVSRAFRKLVAKTGLPPVTLHALRHAHGTLLLDQGLPVHDVAARLGHDPAMLLRVYAHAGRDSQDSAAALESLLGGDRPALRVVSGEDDERDDPEVAAAGSAQGGGD
jgi:integrase